jgi:tRNA(Ile)-lysidine synthase
MASSRSSRSRVCVGFSGGLDSVVLLELFARARKTLGVELSAVHVHHGLSPNADRWARFCAAFCAAREVPLVIERVKVRAKGRGIEAAAREARYAVYARQEAEVIALAHHLDDQAETVLLQLLRGTGLKGVAAMAEWRELTGTGKHIFRPLLAYRRIQLREWAEGLEWIEDESNADRGFDRNYLRHELVPLLDARFPRWREALARFSRHAASADAMLGKLARRDGAPDTEGVAMGRLRSEDPERRANALRAFLEVNRLPMPSERRLGEMVRQLFEARGDARVRIEHGGARLVRHRGAVSIDRGHDPHPRTWRCEWKGERVVDLGAGKGVVRFRRVRGAGIGTEQAAEGEWQFALRCGGERMRLAARRPTRTLKNLLQESRVPEWQRDRLPLLFHGSDLVWVPGVGIAAAYQCAPGAAGLLPEWDSSP